MNNNINSIFRIHALLTKIPSVAQNTQVLEVWAQLFELTESDSNKKAAVVAERLGWLLKEVDLAKSELKNTGHPASLYESVLIHLEHAFSPMLLPSIWSSVQQYLDAQTIQTLAIYSQVVPNEEELIKEYDLNELYARISELEEFLKNSELPIRLQTLIERHINLIRQALAEYPIAGAKALIEARRSAVGELLELKHQFNDVPKKSVELNKLSELWENVNAVADNALKGYGLIEIGQKVIDLLSK
ncbi:MAG: hypothetical protein PSV17_01885 [Methylotenera sp.]|uniref:hypothetical protein n=1 Tax=Methylotenera sp. TaxID=2051956 RepID=UPI0024884196|nr:hypothetical protein [Methylotenera sp.]MDI1308171.1 hypothetical protein [Methylotenera sp.]